VTRFAAPREGDSAGRVLMPWGTHVKPRACEHSLLQTTDVITGLISSGAHYISSFTGRGGDS
jgi:hypothetical protein